MAKESIDPEREKLQAKAEQKKALFEKICAEHKAQVEKTQSLEKKTQAARAQRLLVGKPTKSEVNAMQIELEESTLDLRSYEVAERIARKDWREAHEVLRSYEFEQLQLRKAQLNATKERQRVELAEKLLEVEALLRKLGFTKEVETVAFGVSISHQLNQGLAQALEFVGQKGFMDQFASKYNTGIQSEAVDHEIYKIGQLQTVNIQETQKELVEIDKTGVE